MDFDEAEGEDKDIPSVEEHLTSDKHGRNSDRNGTINDRRVGVFVRIVEIKIIVVGLTYCCSNELVSENFKPFISLKLVDVVICVNECHNVLQSLELSG